MFNEAKKFLISTQLFKDNIYLDKYFQLLLTNIGTKKQKYITQQHHIIPKHVSKIINNDSLNNIIINLKYSDHLLCHYYLCLCCCDLYVLGANLKAINLIMSNRSSIKTITSIQLALEENLDEFYKNLPQIQLDYEKLTKILVQQKRIYITRDCINTCIPIDQLDQYIADGWVVGKYLTEQQHKRRSEIAKMKKSEAAKENMRRGHIGKSSGMKGKKHSKDTLKKFSEGKRGEKNPFFGKNHSEETKKILSDQKKQDISDDIRENICFKYNSGYSVNKLRLEYKMSAKKILRVLLEAGIIDENQYKNLYKV